MYTGTSASGAGADATLSLRVETTRGATAWVTGRARSAGSAATGEGATRDTVFEINAGAAVGNVTSASRRVIGARSYVSAVSQLVPAMPTSKASALSDVVLRSAIIRDVRVWR